MIPEQEQLQADVNARKDALDTSNSYIVQAPAGSGKTELLIQRYLKLLGEVENPEEILAITFTRKAALEMQLRVTSALQSALLGERPDEPHRLLTFELAKTVMTNDSKFNWQLLQSPRRMRIQTLDAFNAGIVRSLPVSSGLGGALSTVSDEQMKQLYREAAAATLDWLTTNDRMSRIVEQVLVHLDNNAALYVSYIARMLESRDQWLGFVGSGGGVESMLATDDSDSREAREAGIARIVTTYLARARDAFPASAACELILLAQHAATSLRDEGVLEHPLYCLDSELELPGTDPAALQAWQALAQLLLTQKGSFRKRVNKTNGFPAGDSGQKKRMEELLSSFVTEESLRVSLNHVQILPEPAYSDQQWQTLGALIRLLPYAVVELRQRFTAAGLTDHIEVAQAAGAALGSADEPGDMALLLDYTIKHLLVDEMQDTSVGQYQLLETLTGGWQDGDGRTLFCVGDPMQSIYRFRDAEVSRFMMAKVRGIGALPLRPLRLRQNFRSGENLVHWFNTVFEQVMPARDDPMTGAVSYSASVPVEIHRDSGDVHVHPLFGATAVDEAEYGFKVIQKCLEQQTGESTVVLVRSRTQLPHLLSRLRRAGVPYQAIEIDRLTDLPEITDLLALTRSMCHQGDRLAWLALLRGPWIGLDWQDLHTLVSNDKRSTVPELLADNERFANLSAAGQQRIREYQALLESCHFNNAMESLRDRLERAWFALGGPALVAGDDQLENVYRFFDVVEKIERFGTIADTGELESLLDAERVSSLPDSNCRLQIMTMHKAKGLQFDNVILYGLGRAASGGTKSVLSWLNLLDDRERDDMIVSPVGPRFELENDPIHQFIEAIDKEKDIAERDRLLYVAATRAVNELHLIGHVPLSSDGSEYKAPNAASLLRRLWPVVEPVFAESFPGNRAPDVVPDNADPGLVNGTLRRMVRDQQNRIAPCVPPSLMSHDPSTEAGSRKVEFYWVGSAARHAGTIVHRFLQKHVDGSIRLDAGRIDEYRNETESIARQLGVADSEMQSVCDRVAAALNGMLRDDRGKWLLEGDGFAELALTGRWQSGVQSIVIDRVLIENDVHWIVDYKTSSHEGGDLSMFLQQEADRYHDQLSKYVGIYGGMEPDRTVRAALYFPMLQEFLEVPIGGQESDA